MFGTALGLLSQPDLHETAVHLDSGDLLCLFTGGLTDACRGMDCSARHARPMCSPTWRTRPPEAPVAALAAAAGSFRGPAR